MKLLDEYFKLQKEIYDYFGYEEDWVVIPIDDATDMYWEVDEDKVTFAYSIEQLKDTDAEDYYQNEIYKQRFLPKWVYPGKDYTMICVDTCVDGNKFLQIFNNAKQVKDEEDES